MITNLVYLRPVPVLAFRTTGPYATSVTEAWNRMRHWLRSSGDDFDLTPGYGLLMDDPRLTDPAQCRYEACIALPPDRLGHPQRLSVKQTPAGAYARMRHVGGKFGIAPMITEMRAVWASKNGLVSDTVRPIVEIYLDDPSKTPIEQQRIDICVPVMVEGGPSPSLG